MGIRRRVVSTKSSSRIRAFSRHDPSGLAQTELLLDVRRASCRKWAHARAGVDIHPGRASVGVSSSTRNRRRDWETSAIGAQVNQGVTLGAQHPGRWAIVIRMQSATHG